MRWTSRSPTETRTLACSLAECVDSEGVIVSLIGPLGAGKTVFAKGVAEGLGIDPGLLASPTFGIAYELATAGGLRLVHADLYRVESESELLSAGLLDWLEKGTLLLVEWGDRGADVLPQERLEVRLGVGPGPDERTLEVLARGAAAQRLLERWKETCP